MSGVKTEFENQKPAEDGAFGGGNTVILPPFPEPTEDDFDDGVSEAEIKYYKSKYPDVKEVETARIHCTACDRHLGCSTKAETRIRSHPMLGTLMCQTCHSFYNSGEFEKGDDGSELYCRWCGQGGQVYCCADCPHVFCAKCVKRNFGLSKIKEIEENDDWKCFKCTPKVLWDLKALCWAVMYFCDVRSKLISKTTDPKLKEKYEEHSWLDHSNCCKRKRNSLPSKKKDEKKEENKVEKKEDAKKENEVIKPPLVLTKMPPVIQVKKFASLIPEQEKKLQKYLESPKPKTVIKKQPIQPIGPFPPPLHIISSVKKLRMVPPPNNAPKRVYTPRIIRHPNLYPQYPQQQQQSFKNVDDYYMNDNINLSLDNLTQGIDLDPSTMSNSDNLLCTPDIALEPICEVTEDNNDDDVECITPGPMIPPKPQQQPPSQPLNNTISRLVKHPDLIPGNIIQMTENDVTVNNITGGLKFRVDPQTLSSNKMYRLPDGRIFAINSNPNMPGGYSATIVAVTENSSVTQSVPKGQTFAAKLSTVNQQESNKSKSVNNSNKRKRKASPSKATPPSKVTKLLTPINLSDCDYNVPVEWFHYNLVDAVDSIEYSLSRLKKMKKEASTVFLRSRSVAEMRVLHKSLDRILKNSAERFNEVRGCLNKEFEKYVSRKNKSTTSSCDDDDDDDDVEILNDMDDPIFIDENSLDSNSQDKSNDQEVEILTSDINDSAEKENDNTGTEDHNVANPSNTEDQTVEKPSSIETEDQNVEKPTNNITMNKDKNTEKCQLNGDSDTINNIENLSNDTEKLADDVNRLADNVDKLSEDELSDNSLSQGKQDKDVRKTDTDTKSSEADSKDTKSSEADSKSTKSSEADNKSTKSFELDSNDTEKYILGANDDIDEQSMVDQSKQIDSEMSEETIEKLLSDNDTPNKNQENINGDCGNVGSGVLAE